MDGRGVRGTHSPPYYDVRHLPEYPQTPNSATFPPRTHGVATRAADRRVGRGYGRQPKASAMSSGISSQARSRWASVKTPRHSSVCPLRK